MYQVVEKPHIEASQITKYLTLEPLTIYLSGSQYDGLGHPYSDVDVFVLVQDHGHRGTIICEIEDDQKFDIEIWSLDRFEELIQQLDAFANQNYDFDHRLDLDLKVINFLYRMCIGEAILHPSVLESIRARINRNALAFDYALTCINHSNLYREDTLGMILMEDHETAAVCARLVVDAALGAWMASRGDAYAGLKWHLKKLRRDQQWELYELYSGLILNKHNLPAQSLAVKMLDLASQLIYEAQENIERKSNESIL